MAMEPDIDRLNKEGIVTFCALNARGRDWMQREFATKYNAHYQSVAFQVPLHRGDSDDFADRAKKGGMVIRFLE